MIAADVGAGVIVGGWEYVGAAYGVFWTVLLGYTLSLWLRSPERGDP